MARITWAEGRIAIAKINAKVRADDLTHAQLASKMGYGKSRVSNLLGAKGGTPSLAFILAAEVALGIKIQEKQDENAHSAYGPYSKSYAERHLCGVYKAVWPCVNFHNSYNLYDVQLTWDERAYGLKFSESARDVKNTHAGEIFQHDHFPIYYFISKSESGNAVRTICASRSAAGTFYGYLATLTGSVTPTPMVAPIVIAKKDAPDYSGIVSAESAHYAWCYERLREHKEEKSVNFVLPASYVE